MGVAESIKSQVLHLAILTTNPVTGSYEQYGFTDIFCCVEKKLRGYWRKWNMFRGLFFKIWKFYPNDTPNFEIERMIS